MRPRIKLLLIAVVALATITTGTAAAATIGISPGGNITAASLGKLTFTFGVISLRCNWTLGGSFATSAAATAGTRMGSVSRVEVASCEGIAPRSINNLPYEVTFLRLLTAEGRTTGIEYNIRNINFTLSGVIFGIVVDCTYEGTIPVLVGINADLTQLVTILTNSLRKTAGGGSCPESGSMRGSFGLSPQQRITLS